MFIHQSEYAEKVLRKFGMLDAKPVSVPADPNAVLCPAEDEDECDNVPYREAVGSLMFLAVVSRPDIAFAVNSVSKYLNKHSQAHWMAVKRIFAYVVGTKGRGILYKSGGNESELVGYCDADFAGDRKTRRSTIGYAFIFANGAISWSSQRQKIVTLSTTESEYVAATAAAREAVWLRKLLEEIGSRCDKATVIWVDNQSAIKLAKNPEFHKCI
ncbi:Retrovirus-related Pol polyprotein from transposon TNT 1-94 [Formica fusca]